MLATGHWAVWAAVLGLAWSGLIGGHCQADEFDCGTNSLFLIHSLYGKPVDLDVVERVLPSERHPHGFTMEELRRAARALNLPLVGRRIDRSSLPLARPAIAFVKKPVGGHFVVLNPVGVTGTMVQVLDPPFAPSIRDYEDLLKFPGWTGIILITESPYEFWGRIAVWAILGLIVVAVIWRVAVVAFRARRARATASRGCVGLA